MFVHNSWYCFTLFLTHIPLPNERKGLFLFLSTMSVMCQKEWPRIVYESSQTYRRNTTCKVLLNCRHVHQLLILPLKTSIAYTVRMRFEFISHHVHSRTGRHVGKVFPTAHPELDATFTSWKIKSRAHVMAFLSVKGDVVDSDSFIDQKHTVAIFGQWLFVWDVETLYIFQQPNRLLTWY